MGEIKSAAEIAREKLEKLEDTTEEERLKWRYTPEGEKIAAKYLKEDCNLPAELGHYEEKAKQYVLSGINAILIRNINLPKNDTVRKDNKKAIEGLKLLKKDKVAAENVFSMIRRIFDHYSEQGEQQKKQAFESLKAQFEARVQQAMQQQGVAANMKIDVERQPQFLDEWQKLQSQLDLQYIKHLDEYKQELSAIT